MGFFGPPPPFVGATTSADGASGLVPAPASGLPTRVLHSDSSFSEPALYPTYKNTSNRYIGAYIFTGSGTTVAGATALALRERRFSLIYAPADGNIDTIATRNATIATSVNLNVALWRIGSDGLPSTYIIGANIASGTTANTDVSASIASTFIKRGFYYISVTPEAATNGSIAALNATMGNIFYRNFLGASILGNVQADVITYTATTYDQTTHESFVLTNVAAPQAGFMYE